MAETENKFIRDFMTTKVNNLDRGGAELSARAQLTEQNLWNLREDLVKMTNYMTERLDTMVAPSSTPDLGQLESSLTNKLTVRTYTPWAGLGLTRITGQAARDR